MRVSLQGKVSQVDESHATTFCVDFAVCGVAPDYLCDLDIKQMRRVERLTRGEQPVFHGFRLADVRSRTSSRAEAPTTITCDRARRELPPPERLKGPFPFGYAAAPGVRQASVVPPPDEAR